MTGSDAAIVSTARPLLGGEVSIHLGVPGGVSSRATADTVSEARRAATRMLDRLAVWASRVTRFDDGSELIRMNRDPRDAVEIGPTLAAVLDWSQRASRQTNGLVDVTLLEARLAAETGSGSDAPRPGEAPTHAWCVEPSRRGGSVLRPPGLLFDLDGVAKGWLADRALAGLSAHRSAAVDADGDIAIRVREGDRWAFAVAHPNDGCRSPGQLRPLALLQVAADRGAPSITRGLATSGTSVHRWGEANEGRHHLIDPRTGRPAATDVVQATVLASSARLAEALAKTVVILGARSGIATVERWGAQAVLVLADDGSLLATPSRRRWSL